MLMTHFSFLKPSCPWLISKPSCPWLIFRGPSSENGDLHQKAGTCLKKVTMINSLRNHTLICFNSNNNFALFLMNKTAWQSDFEFLDASSENRIVFYSSNQRASMSAWNTSSSSEESPLIHFSEIPGRFAKVPVVVAAWQISNWLFSCKKTQKSIILKSSFIWF